MTISGGTTHYYIAVNDRTWDAEEFLDQIGVRPITNNDDSNNTNNTNESTENDNNSTNDTNSNE